MWIPDCKLMRWWILLIRGSICSSAYGLCQPADEFAHGLVYFPDAQINCINAQRDFLLRTWTLPCTDRFAYSWADIFSHAQRNLRVAHVFGLCANRLAFSLGRRYICSCTNWHDSSAEWFANPLLYIWNNSHEQLYLLMFKWIYMCSNWLVIVLTLFRTWFNR